MKTNAAGPIAINSIIWDVSSSLELRVDVYSLWYLKLQRRERRVAHFGLLYASHLHVHDCPDPSALHTLGLLHQSTVVGHDFALRKVKCHFQRYQDGEFKSNQLPTANPEPFLQFLRVEKKKKRCILNVDNFDKGEWIMYWHI